MFLRHLSPSICWAILILILYGIPSKDMPDMSIFKMFTDKIAHLSVFLLFSFFLMIGLKKQRTFLRINEQFIKYAILISSLYGITLELIQGTIFATRTTDILDLIANLIGCFLAIVLFRLVYGNEILKS